MSKQINVEVQTRQRILKQLFVQCKTSKLIFANNLFKQYMSIYYSIKSMILFVSISCLYNIDNDCSCPWYVL